MGGISDRMQEVKRRRHRRKKIESFKRKLKKATASERALMADKLRRLTLGAEEVIKHLQLEDR